MEKLSLSQVVVVEGKYDKIKLESVLDATILVTGGFQIYKDKEFLAMLRTLAKKRGLIILTDSDRAGFQIRGYLAGAVEPGCLTHVYIPDVFGKEKRKAAPSAEGKLGVEGISPAVLREAFAKAGVLPGSPKTGRPITKLDFFEDGLTGGPQSRARRRLLQKKLELPELLSANSLLTVLGAMMGYEEYRNLVDSLDFK
ncbi:DUF4093 domain-containing protein [Oscillospiraceae bacterium MB08-C2-2]|nr:DUF4093 domain-containing protein [Oscillospiraceae bacterium MB08-C2-2]